MDEFTTEAQDDVLILKDGMESDILSQLAKQIAKAKPNEGRKKGYKLKLTYKNTGSIVWEYVPDEDYKPTESGDYIDPIQWASGMSVKNGKWYYEADKDLPHEAIANGVPADFYDTNFFDFVEAII